MFVAGCATQPKPTAPVVSIAPTQEWYLQSDTVNISGVKSVSAPIAQQTGKVFPKDSLGNRILLTSGLGLPHLSVQETPANKTLISLRLANRTPTLNYVNVTCRQEGKKPSFKLEKMPLPGNTARDITIELNPEDAKDLTIVFKGN